MPPSRDRLLLLLIPLAAFFAVLPLLLHGCSCGHDFDFHLLSWQEAARQFAHGNLRPRWAFTPAWGAGEPRFVFYPPLSWTLGALLTLLAAALATLLHLPPAQLFALTPIAYTFLALTLAGLAMHHLARQFVSPARALVAAVLYLTNPYTLFTAYERTAYAELLAAAFLPLLLAALLPSTRSRDPLSILRTAIPLALLWLTNAPAAVIGSYALAFIVLLRLLPLLRSNTVPRDTPTTDRAPHIAPVTRAPHISPTTTRVPHISPERCGSAGRQISPSPRQTALSLTIRATAATALALALAAFYIIPAILERPWVTIGMAVLPGLRPDDNTLFHHTADPLHDAVLHTASLLAVALLTITALALARIRKAPATPILAALTLTIAFLLTPLSLPLWHHLPELAFLQFPWRLLALLAPIAALTLAQALPFPRTRRPENLSSRPRAAQSAAAVERPAVAPAQPTLSLLLLLPLALALILPAYSAFHQPCDDEDTPQARYALLRTPTGDQPTDEYTPVTADNDALKDNNPGYRLLPITASDDTPPSPTADPSAAPLTLDLNLPAPALLVLNLRDYPTWQVTRDGMLDPDHIHRADGLLTLALPAGTSHLRLTQRTPTPELAADALSVLALLLTLVLASRPKRIGTKREAPSITV